MHLCGELHWHQVTSPYLFVIQGHQSTSSHSSANLQTYCGGGLSSYGFGVEIVLLAYSNGSCLPRIKPHVKLPRALQSTKRQLRHHLHALQRGQHTHDFSL